MKIKYLLLSSVLTVSCFNSAHAYYEITRSTEALFKQGMKGCYSATTTARDMTEYFDCLNYETGTVRDLGNNSCSKNIKKNLKSLGCQDDFIKSFTTAYTKDNLHILKLKLDNIKNNYESFKAKDLTASAQVSKYMEIVENNDLEEFMEIDPAIKKEMKDNKAKFMARKNSCSDVMNLKAPLSLSEPRNQDTVGCVMLLQQAIYSQMLLVKKYLLLIWQAFLMIS